MTKQKRVIGVIIRDGICQKSDDEIVQGALFGRAMQLERMLERKKKSMPPDEYKSLLDEKERTFALTERFR